MQAKPCNFDKCMFYHAFVFHKSDNTTCKFGENCTIIAKANEAFEKAKDEGKSQANNLTEHVAKHVQSFSHGGGFKSKQQPFKHAQAPKRAPPAATKKCAARFIMTYGDKGEMIQFDCAKPCSGALSYCTKCAARIIDKTSFEPTKND